MEVEYKGRNSHRLHLVLPILTSAEKISHFVLAEAAKRMTQLGVLALMMLGVRDQTRSTSLPKSDLLL